MYVLDASVFVRDLTPGDPDQATCRALLTQLDAQAIPIHAPLLLLPEVAGAVSRALRDPMRGRLAADLLRTLPNLTLLALDALVAQEATEIAADRALKGADSISVAIARQHGATLVSLDREQRMRAAPIITVMTPAEALASFAS